MNYLSKKRYIPIIICSLFILIYVVGLVFILTNNKSNKIVYWSDFAEFNYEVTTENFGGEDIKIANIKTPEQLAAVFLIEDKKQEIVAAESFDNIDSVLFEARVYRLLNNIDLSGKIWISKPLAHGYTFDGGNFKVNNLLCQNAVDCGFISVNSGTIKNINFVNVKIYNKIVDNTIYSFSNTGAVCGRNTGTISNCFVLNGKIESTGGYVGGIVGNSISNSQISDCYNNASCYNYSSINNYTGGIVGFSLFVDIARCGNSGYIYAGNESVETAYAGGIVGFSKQSTIDHCFNTGKVESIALNKIINIENFELTTNINYSSLTGYNGLQICKMISNAYAGGILGYSDNNCLIEDCYNNAEIVGGKIAFSVRSGAKFTFTYGYNSNNIDEYANIDAMEYDYYVGEISGTDIQVENCFATTKNTYGKFNELNSNNENGFFDIDNIVEYKKQEYYTDDITSIGGAGYFIKFSASVNGEVSYIFEVGDFRKEFSVNLADNYNEKTINYTIDKNLSSLKNNSDWKVDINLNNGNPIPQNWYWGE